MAFKIKINYSQRINFHLQLSKPDYQKGMKCLPYCYLHNTEDYFIVDAVIPFADTEEKQSISESLSGFGLFTHELEQHIVIEGVNTDLSRDAIWEWSMNQPDV